MKTARGFLIAAFATHLSGCATQQAVMPDLKITREIPTEAALAWLKKVAAPEPHIGGGIPACQYNDQGIFARDGKSEWNYAVVAIDAGADTSNGAIYTLSSDGNRVELKPGKLTGNELSATTAVVSTLQPGMVVYKNLGQ